MNFVLFQILWFCSGALFLFLSFFVAKTFLKFKRAKVIFEVIMCLIIFAYLLAFRVNFAYI